MTVTFAVLGEVRTNERARHGKGFTYTPSKTKAARSEIVKAFLEAAGYDRPPHEGPLKMTVTIQHACPAKDFWTGRFCRRKPDLDNVVKLVGDALNGVAYLDDAQIVEVVSCKSYGPISKIEVELKFMEAIERPKHGKIPHPKDPFRWRLWNHGELIGCFVKVGSTYEAYDRNSALLGTYRTQAAAQAAIITEHCQTATP